jgi:hypothetical protein
MKKSGMRRNIGGIDGSLRYDASAPLESSDLIPPIPSTSEISNVGYIPHVPHRQRNVY